MRPRVLYHCECTGRALRKRWAHGQRMRNHRGKRTPSVNHTHTATLRYTASPGTDYASHRGNYHHPKQPHSDPAPQTTSPSTQTTQTPVQSPLWADTTQPPRAGRHTTQPLQTGRRARTHTNTHTATPGRHMHTHHHQRLRLEHAHARARTHTHTQSHHSRQTDRYRQYNRNTVTPDSHTALPPAHIQTHPQ